MRTSKSTMFRGSVAAFWSQRRPTSRAAPEVTMNFPGFVEFTSSTMVFVGWTATDADHAANTLKQIDGVKRLASTRTW
jgi:hypothetical protein